MTNSKPSTVIARPATEADQSKFQEIWKEAFGDNIFGGDDLYASYLNWAFEESPEIRPDSITQWVGEIDDDLIAVWSTVPERLIVNGSPREIIWLQAAATASRARRKGVARTIFKTIVSSNELTLGVGVVEASRALYISEGAHFVNADRFGTLNLSIIPIARSILRSIKHLSFTDTIENFLRLASHLKAIIRKKDSDISISAADEFPPQTDDFIRSLHSEIPIMIRRSAKKLNWAVRNPRYESEIFIAKQKNEIRGYTIIRSDGMILDFLVSPSDSQTFAALLQRIKECAKEKGFSSVGGIIPSIPELERNYIQTGFKISKDVDFGLFYSLTNLRDNETVLDNPQNWYLSLLDSDLWSFRLDS